VVDSLLDTLGQGVGFVLAGDDNHNFASVHDRAHTDRQSHLGDLQNKQKAGREGEEKNSQMKRNEKPNC
jgi:hypothetical protein